MVPHARLPKKATIIFVEAKKSVYSSTKELKVKTGGTLYLGIRVWKLELVHVLFSRVQQTSHGQCSVGTERSATKPNKSKPLDILYGH